MSVPRSIKDPISEQLQVDVADIKFVVDSRSDSWAQALTKRGVSAGSIFTTVNAAYADCTTEQDDVVAVKPGLHTLSADLVWAKNHTHLVGRGGPNTEGDTYVDGTVITSGLSGTSSVVALTITGSQCQFHNATIEQGQAAATAVTAVKVAGPSVTMKKMSILGLMTTTQDTGVVSSSLEIGASASYGYYEDCIIGTPLWFAKTALNGNLYFSNSAAGTVPQDITFKGGKIYNSSATSTNSAVFLKNNYAVDRLLEFRDVTFYNFQVNMGTVLAAGVFKDTCGTTHMVLLSGTTAQYGFEDWSTGTKTYLFVAMPISSGTGGTALIATTT
jgi:hypothetical protein